MSQPTSHQVIGAVLAVAGMTVLMSGTQSVLAAGGQPHAGEVRAG